VWSTSYYLKAFNTGAGDNFGASVALSGDGTHLVIGAPGEDSGATTVGGSQNDESVSAGGAAYGYQFSVTWLQAAYLKPSNIDFGDFFGHTVALSGDGKVLVVSSPGEDSIQANSGAVFTFEYTATWQAGARLKELVPGDDDQFGASVAATANGNDVFFG